MSGEDVTHQHKAINGMNFLVTIVGREDQNYQGVIEWLDTRKKVHFRSMYELWSLIEQAIQLKDGSRDPPRKWESESKFKVI